MNLCILNFDGKKGNENVVMKSHHHHMHMHVNLNLFNNKNLLKERVLRFIVKLSAKSKFITKLNSAVWIVW